MYREGISKLGEMLDLGVKLDLVQKSGSWFNMGEVRLGQGRGCRQAISAGSSRRGPTHWRPTSAGHFHS